MAREIHVYFSRLYFCLSLHRNSKRIVRCTRKKQVNSTRITNDVLKKLKQMKNIKQLHDSLDHLFNEIHDPQIMPYPYIGNDISPPYASIHS